MGLDMYAFTTAQDVPAVDFDRQPDEVEVHYWRKHPNLHGWMEQLYRTKGGQHEIFNCTRVQLDIVDLAQLEHDINNNRLPHTEGFFFGSSTYHDRAGDLKFIEKAKSAIEAGMKVYYYSWW